MEVKSVSHSDSVAKADRLINTALQTFEKGDIFVSRVLEVNGESILFRRNDGQMFSAKMLTGLNLNPGDSVELLVSDYNNNQFVFKALDVMKSEVPIAGEAMTTDGDLLQTSSFSGDKARVLAETLALVKVKPDIPPKVAMFLTQNNIPATQENISALTDMVLGNVKQGDILAEIATMLAPQTEEGTAVLGGLMSSGENDLSAQQNAQGIQSNSDIINNNEANTLSQLIEQPKATAPTPVNQPQAVPEQMQTTTEQSMQEQAILQPLTAEEAASNEAKTQGTQTQQQVNIQAEPAGFEARTQATISENKESAKTNTLFETNTTLGVSESDSNSEVKEIVRHILTMFYRPEEDNNGENIKKSQQNLPTKIKELKLLLKDNDIRNKDTILSKADQIEKQANVLSEIRKFECFQIPIQTNNQQQQTAELYVYQYRKKKADIDPEQMLVVVSMDTQNMGRMEAVINAGQNRVSLKFKVQSSDVRQAVADKQQDLSQRITESGYQVTGFETELIREKMDVTNAIDVLMKEAGVTNEGVDVRI